MVRDGRTKPHAPGESRLLDRGSSQEGALRRGGDAGRTHRVCCAASLLPTGAHWHLSPMSLSSVYWPALPGLRHDQSVGGAGARCGCGGLAAECDGGVPAADRTALRSPGLCACIGGRVSHLVANTTRRGTRAVGVRGWVHPGAKSILSDPQEGVKSPGDACAACAGASYCLG